MVVSNIDPDHAVNEVHEVERRGRNNYNSILVGMIHKEGRVHPNTRVATNNKFKVKFGRMLAET